MYNHSPKVLIVDDMPENLTALEMLLKKMNVEMVLAKSGNEALKATLYHDFSLIILDVFMPDMDGYEIADFLKKNVTTSEIPIIFVTAMDKNESTEIKGYSKGAVDFLYKPINEFVFRSKVKVLLELFQMKKRIDGLILKKLTTPPKILIVSI